MDTTTQEIALIKKAQQRESEELLAYIAPSLDALVADFEKDEKIAALEIPTTSLRKSAEKHFAQAVERYAQLIERHESGDSEALTPFITFYAWFAKQGMVEYAHQWQMILLAGGCADCGTHSH